jgi:hypothetical protein
MQKFALRHNILYLNSIGSYNILIVFSEKPISLDRLLASGLPKSTNDSSLSPPAKFYIVSMILD